MTMMTMMAQPPRTPAHGPPLFPSSGRTRPCAAPRNWHQSALIVTNFRPHSVAAKPGPPSESAAPLSLSRRLQAPGLPRWAGSPASGVLRCCTATLRPFFRRRSDSSADGCNTVGVSRLRSGSAGVFTQAQRSAPLWEGDFGRISGSCPGSKFPETLRPCRVRGSRGDPAVSLLRIFGEEEGPSVVVGTGNKTKESDAGITHS